MPHFIKTGFWALEQRAPKGWLNLEDITGNGGGGASVITVTYTDLQSLIAGNQLVPGSIYKITGFNKNMPEGSPENPNGNLPVVLYDDGTNSGITIYLQAITTNTLSESGHGEFYNPKYGDQTTYNNTDGTGLYGIWDGDNPDEDNVPAYQVDQIVFWGGYAWRNLLGNVGSNEDALNLNTDDWEKLPYSNTTYYEKVIDEIKVDLNNGILIGRTNIENQIIVEFNADQYSWEMGLWSTNNNSNPIAVMGWGLYSKITPEGLTDEFYGISNVKVINSLCETVNFKGTSFINVEMDTAYLNNNYFGKGSRFVRNSLNHNSGIISNILTNFSRIEDNVLMIGSYIQDNTLAGYFNESGENYISSSIDDNVLTRNSRINSNILTGPSRIRRNELTNGSRIENNQSTGNGIGNSSDIQNNILTNSSSIQNNTLTDGGDFTSNILKNNSFISFNTLSGNVENSGYISRNELSDNSYIENNSLTADSNSSYIEYNTLTNNSYIQNNTLTGDAYFQSNILTNNSGVEGNTLINSENSSSYIMSNALTSSSYISSNALTGSYFDNNTLSQNSYFQNNTLVGDEINQSFISYNRLATNSFIESNNLTYSDIDSNTLSDSSNINSNTLLGATFIIDGAFYSASISRNVLKDSRMSGNNISITTVPNFGLDLSVGISLNTLMNASTINDNILESSIIGLNKLDNLSSIGTDIQLSATGNTLSDNSIIFSNQLIDGSFIGTNSLTVNSAIGGNTLISGSQIQLSASGTLTSSFLTSMRIDNTVLEEDLSAATDIFLNTEKNIYTRLDGTKRLSYYNTSDTPTIVNVNA